MNLTRKIKSVKPNFTGSTRESMNKQLNSKTKGLYEDNSKIQAREKFSKKKQIEK